MTINIGQNSVRREEENRLILPKKQENISLHNGNELVSLSEHKKQTIRNNYYNRINKKREYYLGKDRFINHIQYHSSYYQYNNSYVFGNAIDIDEDNDVRIFIPTHFAPANSKEGMQMIAELATYQNIGVSVMEDMSDMLKRLGFYDTGIQLPNTFGEETVEKQILVSNKDWFWDNYIKIVGYYIGGQSAGDEADSDDEKYEELTSTYNTNYVVRKPNRGGKGYEDEIKQALEL